MQRRQRKLRAKTYIDRVHMGNKLLCLIDTRTTAENPWDEFKWRHIVLIRNNRPISSVSGEVQSGNSKALFIYGIIEERVPIHDKRCSNHGIMLMDTLASAKGK